MAFFAHWRTKRRLADRISARGRLDQMNLAIYAETNRAGLPLPQHWSQTP
jgi:hypothetical protein